MPKTAFLGTGYYVPDRIVTNQELAEYMDTSDEWIVGAHRNNGEALGNGGRHEREHSPARRHRRPRKGGNGGGRGRCHSLGHPESRSFFPGHRSLFYSVSWAYRAFPL